MPRNNKKQGRKMDISLVIPVLDEEGSIPKLYQKLKKVLDNLGKTYEIIFIDDGSTDNTYSVLRGIRTKDKRVNIIRFRRNFGKSAALSVGFKHANGDVIITMDGDLQDEPEEIPKFLEKIKEYDLVVGWRFKRKDSIFKTLFSRIFNSMINMSTKLKIHDSNCGFKAYRKELAKDIKVYGELHRYIPLIAKWKKYRVGEVKVNHYPRIHGKSKYTSNRLIRGALDLATVKFLTTYSKRPFHLFGFIGIILLFLGFIINLYLSYLWFLGIGIGERPMLILGVLLMVLGVQFISLGLLGEMVVATKREEDYALEIVE